MTADIARSGPAARPDSAPETLQVGAPGKITAVLGPTNTGKTHFAIERMLGHHSGMIGLPLRLLAREVYDKICTQKPPGQVALITGEEKIIPAEARYFVCTVESMPLSREVAFLAVDEIQLCSDLDRGHIFTDRLLHARGTEETMFLGAETMRGVIRQLLPKTHFLSRTRFSELTYTGARKLSRLPRRSAIVAFSAETVYGLAEVVRRQRGGAAVVLGALSPRTRNAQVELYQNGDVDFMVATDAIGMGLNMDVDHVALAALRKFDGVSVRPLRAGEIGQIAGRAGRYMNDGTFGITADAAELDAEMVEAVETHRFDPVRVIQWRNRDLDFSNLDTLLESLEAPPPVKGLTRARMASDLAALRALAEESVIADAAATKDGLHRLWDVCQIPDFRNISPEEHVRLLATVYRHLLENNGALPEDWVGGQISRLDRTDGDIDTLAGRIASIRTWTYVSNRSDWLAGAEEWQEKARAVEDRLSDALHEALTQRFVDRRTSALMKSLRVNDDLMSEITHDGEVLVEEHFVGRLVGFAFHPDPRAGGIEGKALRQAAVKALRTMIKTRAEQLIAAKDSAFELSDHGRILWNKAPVARLIAGRDNLSPRVDLLADDLLDPGQREAVERRLERWLSDHIFKILGQLVALRDAVDDKAKNGTGDPAAETSATEAATGEAAAEASPEAAPETHAETPAEATAETPEQAAEQTPEQRPAEAEASSQPTDQSSAPADAQPAPKPASQPAPQPARQSEAAAMVGGEPPLTGLARGIAYRLIERFGVINRRDVAEEIKSLDQNDRARLRRYGVRFGEFSIFLPQMLKPAPARLLVILWAVKNNVFSKAAQPETPAPTPPTPGLTSVQVEEGMEMDFCAAAGFRICGQRAVRVDMLERLADLIRDARSKDTAKQPAPSAQAAQAAQGAQQQTEKKPDAARPAPEQAPEQKAEQTPEQTAEQTPEQATSQTGEQAADQTQAQAGAAPDATSSEAAEDTAQPSEQADTPPAEQTGGAASETAPEPAPEMTAKTTAETTAETTGESVAEQRPTIPRGMFEVTPDMMSLVGCSGEEFESILRALGYRPHTMRPREGENYEPFTVWRFQSKPQNRQRPDHRRGNARGPGEAQARTQDGPRRGKPAAASGTRPSDGPRGGQRDGQRDQKSGGEGKGFPGSRQGGKGRKGGKPHGGQSHGGQSHGGKPQGGRDRVWSASPQDKSGGRGKGRAPDPDSPFAALAALKDQMVQSGDKKGGKGKGKKES